MFSTDKYLSPRITEVTAGSDVAVFRPGSGVWYFVGSGIGAFSAIRFGVSEDRPTEAAFR